MGWMRYSPWPVSLHQNMLPETFNMASEEFFRRVGIAISQTLRGFCQIFKNLFPSDEFAVIRPGRYGCGKKGIHNQRGDAGLAPGYAEKAELDRGPGDP